MPLKETSALDRFIPPRDADILPIHKREGLAPTNHRGKQVKENAVTVTDLFYSTLLQKHTKVLKFGGNVKSKLKRSQRLPGREISKTPFKVLDAPNLKDDYYLNLLSWGTNNCLAVALLDSVYLWNGDTGKVMKFCEQNQDIASITFSMDATSIAMGGDDGSIDIWDTYKQKCTRSSQLHAGRVSSCAWSSNLLATGSRDKLISCWDHRQARSAFQLKGHSHQVCGLKWSFDQQKLASGGNDNKLMIWNVGSSNPVCRFTSHNAAVKALAWNPHCGSILASGGGSGDRCIKFWNIQQNSELDSIHTGSQVCNLLFSKNTQELVSSHGYSQNEIICWRYPSLEQSAVLTGHSSRVLFMAMAPAGDVVVTGAGDETLRFWRLFPCHKDQQQSQLDLHQKCLR